MNKIAFFLCIVCFSCVNSVSANAGKVLFAIGDVQIKNAQTIKVSKGDNVNEGDTIITGDKSRAQLLMSDGARVSIRANSQLTISQYQYSEQGQSQVSTTQAKSSMSLLKGGFRTITGAVASGPDKSGYEVKTAVATIGIRGTDYTILYCDDDCLSLDQKNNQPIKNGLYAGVSKGAIVLNNSAGQLLLNPSESGFVQTSFVAPVKLLGPPSSLFGETTATQKSQDEEEAEADASDEVSTEDIIVTEIASVSNEVQISAPISKPSSAAETDTTNNPTTNTNDIVITKVIKDDNGDDVTIDGGEAPEIVASSQTVIATSNLLANEAIAQPINDAKDNQFDNNGNLTQFSTLLSEQVAQLSIGTASQKNVGYDAVSGFRWGRWSNGTATINGANLDLTQQSIHWLSNESFDPSIALTKTGQVSYSLIGNTDPTNNHGDRGILGNATFSADFTNQTVSNELLIGIRGLVWRAVGQGSISNGFNAFSGTYDQVVIDAVSGGSGQFSGFFSSSKTTDNLPTAAGLVYSIMNPSAEDIVSGTVVFSNPQFKNR
ncbi:FecR family protein [Pseudoalteromonas ulvae]|uniref:FecR protein domain-containing protein n=1 Tax=Pseudoalteromonas ulvae TaxID=107327 RepID=A0A244CT37_PSEDV|nr:FecR family protein [Pseudoalteromonas ulvae]OUL58758.1 hypothetical protein B1199_00260 [Pseudoalteromonas ulvae]